MFSSLFWELFIIKLNFENSFVNFHFLLPFFFVFQKLGLESNDSETEFIPFWNSWKDSSTDFIDFWMKKYFKVIRDVTTAYKIIFRSPWFRGSQNYVRYKCHRKYLIFDFLFFQKFF